MAQMLGSAMKEITNGSYKDLPYGVAFVLNVIVIFSLAMASIPSLSYSPHSETTTIIDKNGINSSETDNDAPKIVGGMFLILFVGAALSLVWIWLLSHMAKDIVTITFGVILVVTIISALSMFFQGLAMGGIFSLIIAVLATGAFVYMRPRLEFATVNMRVASEAIKLMPSTIVAAGVVVVMELLFCLLWMMAVVGYATNESRITLSKDGISYPLAQCTTYQYSWPVTIGSETLACPSGSACQACVCDGSVIVHQNGPCFTPTLSAGPYFALLLSLLWASEVFSNVVHVTTAGAVAHWWFHADHELIDSPPSSASTHALVAPSVQATVREDTDGAPASSTGFMGGYHVVRPALLQALSTSFGSICMGSLAVAFLRVVRAVVHYFAEKLRGTGRGTGCAGTTGRALRVCALACVETLLRWLESAVVFFNRYAFCYVAIYGLDFVGASRSVVKMFGERGWTALINDDIVDVVLGMGNVIGGVHLMYVGYGYAQGARLSGANVALMTMLGLFSGFLLFQIAVKVISAAVATVYVCFAERPDVFEVTHPDLFRHLQDAWLVLYPHYKKMPPYDAEAVNVTSNKAFSFTFPTSALGTGGGGRGGLGMSGTGGLRAGAGGGVGAGWNTYRPPTEDEVLAASRGATTSSASAGSGVGRVGGVGLGFSPGSGPGPVAGSSYRPLFVSNDDLSASPAVTATGAADGGGGGGSSSTGAEGAPSISELAASAYSSLASMVPRPASSRVQYSYEVHQQRGGEGGGGGGGGGGGTNVGLHQGDGARSAGSGGSSRERDPDEETVTF